MLHTLEDGQMCSKNKVRLCIDEDFHQVASLVVVIWNTLLTKTQIDEPHFANISILHLSQALNK